MINRCILLLTLTVLSFITLAEEKYQFETAQQRADFLLLSKELRCPKCQNQNIADSNALIANDMKRKVHQLLLEGKSKQEVIDFMKLRYGEFVHYQPPMTPVTFWLYFGPLLFVVLCGSYFILQRRRSSSSVSTDASNETSDASQAEKLKRAETALKEMK